MVFVNGTKTTLYLYRKGSVSRTKGTILLVFKKGVAVVNVNRYAYCFIFSFIFNELAPFEKDDDALEYQNLL